MHTTRTRPRLLATAGLTCALVGCGAQTDLDSSPERAPSKPQAQDTAPTANRPAWESSDAFAHLEDPPIEDGISPDDRYIVRLGSAGADAIERAGGTVLVEVGNGLVAARLDRAQLASLQQSGAVDSIDVDPRRYLFGESEQVPYGVDMVRAPEVTTASDPAAKIKVCVIDSGYSVAHEDLSEDVTATPDTGTGAWDVDGCGHGTHVAGTIAALQNGLGVVGVAPDSVKLHIIKTFDDNCSWTYSSILVRAVRDCVESGAKIVSMSLGGASPHWFEELSFEWAHLRGVLSIAAAGNAGDESKSYPASYDHVVSVAAVDADGQVASFSQRNDQVELAAPGVSVLSTVPSADGGNYAAWSGTSMATPHVSAVAALVWSRHPGFSNRRVRRALRGSAFDLYPEGRDNATGFGLVQAAGALEELESGSTDASGSGGGSSSDGGSCSCE